MKLKFIICVWTVNILLIVNTETLLFLKSNKKLMPYWYCQVSYACLQTKITSSPKSISLRCCRKHMVVLWDSSFRCLYRVFNGSIAMILSVQILFIHIMIASSSRHYKKNTMLILFKSSEKEVLIFVNKLIYFQEFL